MTIVIDRRKPTNNITMEGPTSSINSRATAIKTILLAAWRGKLSNEQWESRIRKVLPRGVNGDVYDLADCLLKQALIGPVPNQLFLNYIRHAVSCELVSHGAVLTSISNQPINLRMSSTLIHRTSPIICLLDFLRSFRDKISCNGTEVECLNLCRSLSELINWLLKCIQQTIEFLIVSPPASSSLQQAASNMTNTSMGSTNSLAQSGFNSNPSSISQIDTLLSILDFCTETIHYFVNRPFTKSLLFISKIEYSKEFNQNIISLVHSIIQRLTSSQQLQFLNDRIAHLGSLHELSLTFNSRELHPSVVAARQLGYLQTNRIRSTQNLSSGNRSQSHQQLSYPRLNDSDINYALFNSLYPLVAFDAILRPARLKSHLARQIVTITNFSSAQAHTTYCELIRVCLIGLYGAHGNSKAKATWSFFTFLKLPRLLIELSKLFDTQKNLTNSTNQQQQQQQQTQQNLNESANPLNFINDLKQAFERLCKYSPLLDEAENKYNCDLYKCLVKELIKIDPSLIQLRNLDFRKHPTRRPVNSPNNNSLPGGHMISRTEPVVTHMLDTLNSEQDPVELFGVLCQSCSGLSFEYTLSAAAATGRLHIFVKRLIEHNELYKSPRENVSPKHFHAQALNFDITFLILIYIAQRYGSELIEMNSNATFNRWYYESYNQSTCSNCPKEMLKNCDDEIVVSLIKQLVDPNEDIQFKSTNWSDVCFNVPKALSEILNAWVQEQLSDEDIAIVIERLRSRMCLMAVVASNWLQCHIKTLNETDKVKPLFILNNLGKASQVAKQHRQISSDAMIMGEDSNSELKSWGYSERSSLMGAIVRRIHFELVPSKSSSIFGSNSNGSKQTVASSNSQAGPTAQGPGAGGPSEPGEETLDELSYHSCKDRFMSTLSAKALFTANVKQCLSEGSTDYNSLNSLSSLFKIIGSKSFTSLIVDEILTSHESPSDLGRAVNISFGLFHLDIEACAFALLDDVITNWLIGEKKQIQLSQPRAFALADLAAKTIIEVYYNLKTALSNLSETGDTSGQPNEPDRKFRLINGLSQESGVAASQQLNSNSGLDSAIELSSSIGGGGGGGLASSNGNNNYKRFKSMHHQEQLSSSMNGIEIDLGQSANWQGNGGAGGGGGGGGGVRIRERLDKLNGCIANLMRLFKEIMSEPVMSHRTLFPVLFLQQTVVCAREAASMITVHLKPETLLDIIDLFSSELTFELVLAISNMSTTHGRKYTAKSVCKLAQLMSVGSNNSNNNSVSSTTGGGGASGAATSITTATNGGGGGGGSSTPGLGGSSPMTMMMDSPAAAAPTMIASATTGTTAINTTSGGGGGAGGGSLQPMSG